MVQLKNHSLRGDTLVEVLFSITVFAMIAVLSINLMNNGVNTAQSTLEITMARNEIDAQAEGLRFIQNSYLAEKELAGSRQFTTLWNELIKTANEPAENLVKNITSSASCAAAYNSKQTYKYFALNTRLIQPEYSLVGSYGDAGTNYSAIIADTIIQATKTPAKIVQTPVYPRIIYSKWGSASTENSEDMKESSLNRKVELVEGLWVVAVKGGKIFSNSQPEYYDFYIRTCWAAPGRSVPSTIGTVVRLYNPEVIE